MFRRCGLIALALFACTVSLGQKIEPPTQAELDKITRRGRLLAEYDQAAWHSSDAVMALKPDRSKLTFYAAQKTAAGWVAVFGRLSERRDRALVLYEASQGESPTRFNVVVHDPPREDTGFFLSAARAIPLALGDYPRAERPYNVAVIPAESEDMYIYIQPAQTKTGVYPLGGDVRYRISADGSTILEKRQLHRTILEVGNPDPKVKWEGGYHIHVLSDIPEDTDVFHVLRQDHPVPEIISSKKYTYIIQPDGSIVFAGDTDKFLQKKE